MDPNAELVVWSRMGSATSRRALADAIADGQLIERRGFLRPADDIALFADEIDAWRRACAGEIVDGVPAPSARWVADNDGSCMRCARGTRCRGRGRCVPR